MSHKLNKAAGPDIIEPEHHGGKSLMNTLTLRGGFCSHTAFILQEAIRNEGKAYVADVQNAFALFRMLVSLLSYIIIEHLWHVINNHCNSSSGDIYCFGKESGRVALFFTVFSFLSYLLCLLHPGMVLPYAIYFVYCFDPLLRCLMLDIVFE